MIQSRVQVRDGKIVANTCSSCGCRLSITIPQGKGWSEEARVISHFFAHPDIEGRDARGCRCEFAELVLMYESGFFAQLF